MIRIVVVPPQDIGEHVEGTSCKCKPFIKRVHGYEFEIHNAFDFRNIPSIMFDCGVISMDEMWDLTNAYHNVLNNILYVCRELRS